MNYGMSGKNVSGRLLLAPILMGTFITIILSINLKNALPDVSFSVGNVPSSNNSTTFDNCSEMGRILSRRKRVGDTLKWFWDTFARPALKTTLKNTLHFAGHTKENADDTVEWVSDQLDYLAHTRKYRLLARFIERRIAYLLTNIPILIRDGFSSKCFVPLYIKEP